ncbi:MAG: sigma-70 family RNA polymerase sigma factor [Bacteroidota bacterium]
MVITSDNFTSCAFSIYTLNDKMAKSHRELDDLQLWKLFSQGNRQTMGELYRRHFRKVFLFCYDYTKDKDEATDLTQEVFKKLLTYENTKIYDFAGLLFNTANYLWRTKYRNERNRQDHNKVYKDACLSHIQSHSTCDVEFMRNVIDKKLTDTNAQIIHLASDGFSNQEIAQKLGLTEKQVRTRKWESKKKLEPLKKLIGE